MNNIQEESKEKEQKGLLDKIIKRLVQLKIQVITNKKLKKINFKEKHSKSQNLVHPF